MTTQSLSVFAPAKINLFLHVTGKRDDGYHELDSLVAFADIGDVVTISEASNFSFKIDGPFAEQLDGNTNLVVQAAEAFASETGQDLNIDITLTKNLPVAAGIGGGSADAAAAMYGLSKLWGVSPSEEFLLKLGADVPVCFASSSAQMQGIGEQLSPVSLPEAHIVLVNPNIECSTVEVFKNFDEPHQSVSDVPKTISDYQTLIEFLAAQENALSAAAQKAVPEIKDVLNALENADITRLSGSGATCFGLFDDQQTAQEVAQHIQETHPSWWVHATVLEDQDRS